jgi:hypothetical protein
MNKLTAIARLVKSTSKLVFTSYALTPGLMVKGAIFALNDEDYDVVTPEHVLIIRLLHEAVQDAEEVFNFQLAEDIEEDPRPGVRRVGPINHEALKVHHGCL